VCLRLTYTGKQTHELLSQLCGDPGKLNHSGMCCRRRGRVILVRRADRRTSTSSIHSNIPRQHGGASARVSPHHIERSDSFHPLALACCVYGKSVSFSCRFSSIRSTIPLKPPGKWTRFPTVPSEFDDERDFKPPNRWTRFPAMLATVVRVRQTPGI